MHNVKRLLCLVMALCLVFGVLPVTAFAATLDANVTVTVRDKSNMKKIGSFTDEFELTKKRFAYYMDTEDLVAAAEKAGYNISTQYLGDSVCLMGAARGKAQLTVIGSKLDAPVVTTQEVTVNLQYPNGVVAKSVTVIVSSDATVLDEAAMKKVVDTFNSVALYQQYDLPEGEIAIVDGVATIVLVPLEINALITFVDENGGAIDGLDPVETYATGLSQSSLEIVIPEGYEFVKWYGASSGAAPYYYRHKVVVAPIE